MTKNQFAEFCRDALEKYNDIRQVCAPHFGEDGIIVKMIDLTRNKIARTLQELASLGLKDSDVIPAFFAKQQETIAKELKGWSDVTREFFKEDFDNI